MFTGGADRFVRRAAVYDLVPSLLRPEPNGANLGEAGQGRPCGRAGPSRRRTTDETWLAVCRRPWPWLSPGGGTWPCWRVWRPAVLAGGVDRSGRAALSPRDCLSSGAGAAAAFAPPSRRWPPPPLGSWPGSHATPPESSAVTATP